MSEKKTSFHHDTGKGSRPRSYSVTQEEFGKNWDAIFGKKNLERAKEFFENTEGDFEEIKPSRTEEILVAAVSSEGQMPDVG